MRAHDDWVLARLTTEIERLFSLCVDESLNGIRKYVYIRCVIQKLKQLEIAAGGSESVSRILANFEEQLLDVVKVPKNPTTDQDSTQSIYLVYPITKGIHGNEEECKQNDDLHSELQNMTTALKESSVNMHRKLTSQYALLDKLDENTQMNLDSIVGGRTSLERYRSKSTQRLFASLGSIFGVGISFAFSYMLIKSFPKSYST